MASMLALKEEVKGMLSEIGKILKTNKQEATSSLYSGLQKYSEWCMVNLALKKRTERSLSFSHRPYIAILMMFDCVCSEYPDPDYLHYRW